MISDYIVVFNNGLIMVYKCIINQNDYVDVWNVWRFPKMRATPIAGWFILSRIRKENG